MPNRSLAVAASALLALPVLAQATWTSLEGQLPPPSQRTGVAMTYDSHRDRHVVFGGRLIPGGADLAETWELEGSNWQQRFPANTPSARADAGLAYDSARQRTVLFGGRSGGPCGTTLSDTWEWDGQDWLPKNTPDSPPAAGGTQLAFDSRRQRTWALCGSEMWSYDGTTWTRGGRPSARGNFGCTYDSERQRLVMFGGSTNFAWLDETWEWDGSTWRLRTRGYPSNRATLGMAYDPTRQLHFMLGGWNGSNRLGDAYTWNGTAWTPIDGLSARSDVVLAYDPGGQRVLVVGGYSTGSGWLDDTYAWTGTSWASSATLHGPRHWTGIAHDPIRQRMVMFGGGGLYANQLSVFDHTSVFDGISWTRVFPPTAPPARGGHRLVFDSHTQQVLMYGGTNHYSFPIHQDTWTWDGTTWTERLPQHSPGPRYEYGLVSTGTRTLLVYGAGSGNVHDDIWEWTGSDWLLVESQSQDPAARTNHGAAYDSLRDRVVVFGGREQCGSGSFLNETWEWDGDSWQQRFPANSPSPRERSNLAFDASRNRVVLFGGADGSNTFCDTWEWDGGNWTQMLPTISPTESSGHGLSFDRQDEVTVAFGSIGTWAYRPQSPPMAIAGDDFSVDEAQAVVLDGSASTGPPGMTYAWMQTAGTTVTLLDAGTPQPSFVAPGVAIGGETLTFTLTVTANGLEASDIVNVTVVNVNHPPVAEAGEDQSIAEDSPATLRGEASFDIDMDSFTYSWVQVSGSPTVTLTGSNTANPTFTAPVIAGSGAPGIVATLVFALTVDDGFPLDAPAPGYTFANVVDTVTIQITNRNNDPTANAGADQTVNENAAVTLNGSASTDPDSDALTYSWSQTGGPMVTLTGALTAAPTFTAPFVGAGGADLTFELAVDDGYFGTATNTMVVHVQNFNDPPLASAARPTIETLWPPTHQMTLVGILGVTDPDNNATITIQSVTQDEPTSGTGGGDTPIDAIINANGTVLLRAERAANGNGRVYHIHFTASDLEGSTSGMVTVRVPHTKKSVVIDDGELFSSTN